MKDGDGTDDIGVAPGVAGRPCFPHPLYNVEAKSRIRLPRV